MAPCPTVPGLICVTNKIRSNLAGAFLPQGPTQSAWRHWAAAVWWGGKSCCSRCRKKELALSGGSEVILHLATEGQARVCQGCGTGWGTRTAEVQGSEGWHVLGTGGKSLASWAVGEVKRPAGKRSRSGGCQGGCLGVRQVPAMCRRRLWIGLWGRRELLICDFP